MCVVHGAALFVFGGYDGRSYFDDCYEFAFEPPLATAVFSLAGDLEQMVNNEQFSDIRFRVEGRIVHAHHGLCIDALGRRCEGGSSCRAQSSSSKALPQCLCLFEWRPCLGVLVCE